MFNSNSRHAITMRFLVSALVLLINPTNAAQRRMHTSFSSWPSNTPHDAHFFLKFTLLHVAGCTFHSKVDLPTRRKMHSSLSSWPSYSSHNAHFTLKLILQHVAWCTFHSKVDPPTRRMMHISLSSWPSYTSHDAHLTHKSPAYSVTTYLSSTTSLQFHCITCVR